MRLQSGETGVALVVRRHGVPVGFTLHAAPTGSVLTPVDLDALVARAAAEGAVREAVIDQLGGRGAPTTDTLTVAVCTHDRPAWLRRCLRALVDQVDDSGDSGAVEVLVVDNAPADDATAAVVAELSGVRYVREPTPGLDFARNRAVAEATGDLIAFVDDDVVVDEGWLAALRQAWGDHPDAGCVTGLVLPLELASDAQVAFERYGGFRRGFETVRYDRPTVAGNPCYPFGAGIFGSGCNMSFRRGLVAELGGFDVALDTGPPLPGGGDLDMFARVVRTGHPLVYEPRAAVRHEHRREHAALRRQLYTWGTGFMAFLAKTWSSDPAARVLLARLALWWFRERSLELARSLVGRSPLSPDVALAHLWGGVVGLAGSYRRSQRRTARLRDRYAAPAA